MIVRSRTPRWLSALRWCFVLMSCAVAHGGAQQPPAAELRIFKTWLDRVHPGYACDEGPARFRAPAVEAAYAGRRFYYVLTYTRGMRPRLPKELSVVAQIDDSGNVTPLNPSSPATYRPGLRRVSTARDARLAAAAVLILAMGGAGERPGRLGGSVFTMQLEDSLLTIRKERKGWVSTYGHAGQYTSRVTFDGKGVLSTISVNLPPVP